ncbi:MAG: hypothetical protein DMF84_31395 [Acidobacteria bacterium]|nr:MAG: hypothetical protein DMF84_31395 [Acidobacteriota bacterium]
MKHDRWAGDPTEALQAALKGNEQGFASLMTLVTPVTDSSIRYLTGLSTRKPMQLVIRAHGHAARHPAAKNATADAIESNSRKKNHAGSKQSALGPNQDGNCTDHEEERIPPRPLLSGRYS